MDKIALAINGVSALIMAGATALLGMTIPGIWTLQSDMGSAKATLAAIDKRLEGIERKLDGIDGKVDQVVKRADAIDGRLAARDTDPATIVAQSGLRPDAEFVGIRVGQSIFALPRSDKAAAVLENSGAKREAIAPTIFGWRLGNIDQSGRFISVGEAAGQAITAPFSSQERR